MEGRPPTAGATATTGATKKRSLVDYSRLESRPHHRAVAPAAPIAPAAMVAPAASAGAAGPPTAAPGGGAAAVSSSMQAVLRLMAGQEERTVRDKIEDPNRPTWDQYKRQNQDRLQLDGVEEQKQMERYRRELDAERDKILSRGRNHVPRKDSKKKKKKKRSRRRDSDEDSSDSDSESGGSGERRKHKKKNKHKKKRRHGDSSDESDDSDSHDRQPKKKHKKKKKPSGDDDSDGDHYRLSTFFSSANDD